MVDQILKFFGKNKWALPTLAVVCVLSIGLMIFGFITRPPQLKAPEFQAPPFAENAISGAPDAEAAKKLGYSELYQEGMGFKAGVCGVVNIKDGAADLYFTNPKENDVWMKLRVTDEEGEIIAETGLIKPGEYLKTVTFTEIPKAGAKIGMKVMTYVPESYESAGAVSISTTVAG